MAINGSNSDISHCSRPDFDFRDLERSFLLTRTLREFLGAESVNAGTETITRQACFLIRATSENPRVVRRLIVFPPGGYTADRVDLLAPHPEAREARVKVMGGIRPASKGFAPLPEGLRFKYSPSRDVPTETTSANSVFSEEHGRSRKVPWKNWFYVVKKNGWGSSHNLVNHSARWVVCLLHKELVDQKPIRIDGYLDGLPAARSRQLRLSLTRVQEIGDAAFRDESLVSEILGFPVSKTAPILLRMLNTSETGKHEPCTFFAILLKIAEQDPELILHELTRARETDASPHYYLADLERKLRSGRFRHD